jgi:hypothetical protein
MKQNISQAEKVVAFVTKKGSVDKDQICTTLGINKTYIYELMTKLRKNGQLAYDASTKMYSLPTDKSANYKKSHAVTVSEVVTEESVAEESVAEVVSEESVAEVVSEESVAEVVAEESVAEVVAEESETAEETGEEAETKPRNHGRDFSKFIFNGEELRKGKYFLAAFTAMLTGQQWTKAKLDKHEVFGKLYTSVEEARKINLAGKQRYFNRRDQIITLECGNKICVTNQIGSKNFKTIMDAIQQTGFKL